MAQRGNHLLSGMLLDYELLASPLCHVGNVQALSRQEALRQRADCRISPPEAHWLRNGSKVSDKQLLVINRRNIPEFDSTQLGNSILLRRTSSLPLDLPWKDQDRFPWGSYLKRDEILRG